MRASTLPLTEGDPLPEDIDVDPEERREARGKEKIEARHPAANDRTLLQSLLCELAKNTNEVKGDSGPSASTIGNNAVT